MQRRVVITGLGLVTPLGASVRLSWNNLIKSKSGLISTSLLPDHEQYKEIPSQVVGKVPEPTIANVNELTLEEQDYFNPLNFMLQGEIRKIPKFAQYALCAAKEALTDANWFPETYNDQINTGACIGSGIGSIEDAYLNSVNLHEKGYRRVQPLFVPRLLSNMASGHVSIKYGLKGPLHSVATACATGAHAIGDSMRFIQSGYCDVMIAGATEALIHPLSLAGFARAKSVVTSYNDDPKSASRPFDKNRNGFVLGEGSGVLVLEELEHLLARGVTKFYGEVCGYGLSGDANHITSPPSDGDGARRSMELALKTANLKPEQVDYINAHATSTLLGDAAENCAINTIFSSTNKNLAISSSKSAIGHLLGAAGAVESIFSVLAMYHNIIPPTLNLHHLGGTEVDDELQFKTFNYVANTAQQKELNVVMSNSFGFGGTNATVCFKKI